MNTGRLKPPLCASLALVPGCTTMSAGLARPPPGVNRYSFRECLADNGFLTDTALVGIPAITAASFMPRNAQPMRAGH